jgi:hypothetical protein
MGFWARPSTRDQRELGHGGKPAGPPAGGVGE